ncbi:MAG: DUF309 domain-containing protein [Bryobacteraceae bacterium]
MNAHLAEGIRLFNNGEFFRCHEVLEEAWVAERGALRLFLQALIHISVGFYHYGRGNPLGAVRQLTKGIHKLEAYLPRCEGVDTGRIRHDAEAARKLIGTGAPLAAYPQIKSAADESP